MARPMGKTRIPQANGDRRNSEIPPRNRSAIGMATPSQGQSGATRFKGLTKISSSAPAAEASRAASIGNGHKGRKAKYQKAYIVVYGLSSAADAQYDTAKLANHPIPIAIKTAASRRRPARRLETIKIMPHPATTKAEAKESHGAVTTEIASTAV